MQLNQKQLPPQWQGKSKIYVHGDSIPGLLEPKLKAALHAALQSASSEMIDC